MAAPLVSIIIPTYNTGQYIKEAVDSALCQTYKNCEVIVVDDGSTDQTKVILKPHIESKKIIYIYQENKGLAGARNTGIRAATGDYIAFLDADDVFLPEKIGRQMLHFAKNPTCDVSYCDLYHFYDEKPGELLKLNYTYYSGTDVFPNLLKRHFIAPLSVIMRRSVFDRFGYFDEQLRRAEDLDLWFRISYLGGKICFVPEQLAKLRMRKTQNLQGLESQPEVKRFNLLVLEKQAARMEKKEKMRYHMRRYLALYRLKAAFAYLLIGDKKQAKPYVRGAFNEYPFGWFAGFILWYATLSWIPSVLLKKIVQARLIAKRAKNFI